MDVDTANPGDSKSLQAREPHEGDDHGGPEHALAIPVGVSTILRVKTHKRPKIQKRPRDETLRLHLQTGFYADTELGSILQHNSIPVLPWCAQATLFDWTELALPHTCHLSFGTSGMYCPQVKAGYDGAYPAGYINVAPWMVPRQEWSGTAPTWEAANFNHIEYGTAGRLLVADTQMQQMLEDCARLRVNGQYYEVTLAFQGKIHVPPSMHAEGAVGYGGGIPWVRLVAFQFTGPDNTNLNVNQVPLSYFYADMGSSTEFPERDPDYPRRLNSKDKDILDRTVDQPYKVLHDHTWQLLKPDGTALRQIPLKLKLTPTMIREFTDADYKEPGTNHLLPRMHGQSVEGRIVWGLFHNLMADISGEEHLQWNHTHVPFWEGRWTLEIRDGNF